MVLDVELVEFTEKVKEKIITGPKKNVYCKILQKHGKIFYKNQFCNQIFNKFGNAKCKIRLRLNQIHALSARLLLFLIMVASKVPSK